MTKARIPGPLGVQTFQAGPVSTANPPGPLGKNTPVNQPQGPTGTTAPAPAKPPTHIETQQQLFDTCTVSADHLADVTATVTTIQANKSRYQAVTASLGTMPWWFVAVVHSLEGDLDFGTHLHNGDPLTARTKHVPKGRPAANPAANPGKDPSADNPYTWEESALDSMQYQKFDKWTDWSIGGALEKLEEYNGLGYRLYHTDVHSAYLWSFTNYYTAGKYAEDGKWDATLVSKQAGTAAILRVMVDSKFI